MPFKSILNNADFIRKVSQLLEAIFSHHMGVFNTYHALAGKNQFGFQGEDHVLPEGVFPGVMLSQCLAAATHIVADPYLDHLLGLALTFRYAIGALATEGTLRGWGYLQGFIWRLRGPSRFADIGYRRQKAERVGMARAFEQVGRGCRFHDLAAVHDANMVADITDHIQVMGNEEITQA